MRGTAAILVCLVSLHYSSVIDAYTARFTSENGMPGREHEDKHPRRSTNVKRSLSKTMRQEPDYNWENYGGIPNIPGYMYRDMYPDLDLAADDFMDDYGLQRQLNPEDRHSRRSADAKRSPSSSPDKTMRQYYYDDFETYGGIPNIPIGPFYNYRDAGIDADTGADADKSSFSTTLKRLLSPVVDAMRQLWGKVSGKSLEGVGGGDTKRVNARNEPTKKGATENRNNEDKRTVNSFKRNGDLVQYMADIAKKVVDFAYNVIDKIDESQLTEESKKLKEAVLEILKKARDALGELLGKVISLLESPSSRRTRAVGKRTNARDALDSYLTTLKSHKRSKTRDSHRRSMRGSASARATDLTTLMDMLTEMEECIRKITPTNTSRLGEKCIVLPLMKVLGSAQLGGGAEDLIMDADSNVRSDAIEGPDNLRRLSFPWGSIFLIPIYNGHRPSGNATVPPFFDQGYDNETTTTTEPPTTTTTTSTTEAIPLPIYDERDRSARSDSKYLSKYDSDF